MSTREVKDFTSDKIMFTQEVKVPVSVFESFILETKSFVVEKDFLTLEVTNDTSSKAFPILEVSIKVVSLGIAMLAFNVFDKDSLTKTRDAIWDVFVIPASILDVKLTVSDKLLKILEINEFVCVHGFLIRDTKFFVTGYAILILEVKSLVLITEQIIFALRELFDNSELLT